MVSDDEVYDFEPLIAAEVGAGITNGSKTTLPTGELKTDLQHMLMKLFYVYCRYFSFYVVFFE